MKLLMLDSGAFSVWTKGEEINLNEYIEFASKHPEVSYYVALDVLSGTFGGGLVQPKTVEASCQKGWDAYQKMIKTIPMEKVIPTFHRGDPISWLHKYLDFGVKYIAIGGLADKSSREGKMKWLQEIKPYFLRNGKVKVKVHGFGFSNMDLMNCFPWHSLDSASWAYKGSMGVVWIPRKTGGKWDYTKSPYIIACTPRHPDRYRHNCHYDCLSPLVKKNFHEYLEEVGIPVGKSEVLRLRKIRKLKKGELWIEKGEIIQKALVDGVTNKRDLRQNVTIYYLKQAEKFLSVEHLYFAGNPVNKEIEQQLHKRLLSYAFLKSKTPMKIFNLHCKQVRQAKRLTECQ